MQFQRRPDAARQKFRKIDLRDFPDVPSREFLRKQIEQATKEELALALLVVRYRMRRLIFKSVVAMFLLIPLIYLRIVAF